MDEIQFSFLIRSFFGIVSESGTLNLIGEYAPLRYYDHRQE